MRRPSRLTSTICGAPFSGFFGCLGCAARRTIPPRCTEPVFFGCNGSETSYCRNSPVPKQETYKKRSSSERLMSVLCLEEVIFIFLPGHARRFPAPLPYADPPATPRIAFCLEGYTCEVRA